MKPIDFEIIFNPAKREWHLRAEVLPSGLMRFADPSDRNPGFVGLIGAISTAIHIARERGGTLKLRFYSDELELRFDAVEGGGNRLNNGRPVENQTDPHKDSR